MYAIHANARTTPAVRAEIARSSEPSSVLARRYGGSTETIRKGRKRGAADCQDHSSRPHKLPWTARAASGTSMSPSTAPPASSTWPSGMMRPSAARSPS